MSLPPPSVSMIWSRLKNRPVQYFLDVSVLSGAFLVAYAVRFDFHVSAETFRHALAQLPLVVLLQFAALSAFGAYAFIWKYVGLAETLVFSRAALAATVPLVVMRLALPETLQDYRIPLSIIVMDACLGFGGVLSLRMLRRFMWERWERGAHASDGVEKKRVLLVGAGRAGVLALREILGRGDAELNVRGFVDDDPAKQDSVIQGVRVLGTTGELAGLVRHLAIDEVVITIVRAPRKAIRRIVRVCEEIPVRVRIMPGIWEILQGDVEVSSIRDVQIEDLLGRDPVTLDEEELRRFLVGSVVMVTGAGGSIGSELARQVARLGPRQLLLVERAEFALFDVDREIRRRWPDSRPVAVVADVGDEARMRRVFEDHRPQIILHAAAHKHVPLMEANASEAIRNNVLATARLGTLAGEYGVDVFVMISTDKAVRPTSVMGASKRVAELVVQDLDRRYRTRFVAVRFGNVLGSAGSVIPIFREQIRNGGPVTITHPDMVRFFMTIPEASQLVLQAGAMGGGGEVFVLDMGEPVRIVDLAHEMITLSGLKPNEDIEVVFTGIRPGEKLYEEMGTDEENVAPTGKPKILIGKIRTSPPDVVERALAKLHRLAEDGGEDAIRRFLMELLPDARLGGAAPLVKAVASGASKSPGGAAVA
ncbi:MAG: polysaccharide biosynthesis protein [Thermoanaerobaculia bacterium]|nr:polysaccharide biosynthesis protein [Thermoanaerobaculia bacterium]